MTDEIDAFGFPNFGEAEDSEVMPDFNLDLFSNLNLGEPLEQSKSASESEEVPFPGLDAFGDMMELGEPQAQLEQPKSASEPEEVSFPGLDAFGDMMELGEPQAQLEQPKSASEPEKVSFPGLDAFGDMMELGEPQAQLGKPKFTLESTSKSELKSESDLFFGWDSEGLEKSDTTNDLSLDSLTEKKSICI